MIVITLPSGEYLIVDVPEDSSNFQIKNNDLGHYIDFETILHENDPGTYYCINLPPSDWQLLGLESEITEEVAASIVEKMEGRVNVKAFVDYEYPDSGMWSAIKSLASLSKREGMVNPVWLKKV